MEGLTFQGTDASLEISLLEYGLLVSEQEHEDGSGTHFIVYNVEPDVYDTGHISESQVNGYILGTEFPDNESIQRFLSYVGADKETWTGYSLPSKLHDLLQYFGVHNIMGSSHGCMTEKEATERYLTTDK